MMRQGKNYSQPSSQLMRVSPEEMLPMAMKRLEYDE